MTTSEDKITRRIHAIVRGRVQGVSFRAYTQLEARKFELAGWVRNLPDGTVETVAEGTEQNLRNFIAFLHQGPTSALVDDVTLNWLEAKLEFDTFRIRYF